MTNNLILIGENDNLVVERFKLGGRIFEFVHDKNTGYNYFKQKDLSNLFGITYVTVGEHLNKYLKSLESKDFFARIKLKTNNGTKRVSFYGFDAVKDWNNCYENIVNCKQLNRR